MCVYMQEELLTTIACPFGGPIEHHSQYDIYWGRAWPQFGVYHGGDIHLNLQVNGLHAWSHEYQLAPVWDVIANCGKTHATMVRITDLDSIHSQRIVLWPGL
jgi:hypothetical protein